MTAEQEWFFVRNGQQDGPHTLEQMKRWVAERRIAPTDLVWSAHLPDWMPAQGLPEFADVLRGGPPMPPPSVPQPRAPYPQAPYQQPRPGQYPNARPYPNRGFAGDPYAQHGGAYPRGYQSLQGTTPGIVITGFVFAFLCPLVGLILCIIGHGDAKKRQAGEGLAVAGIVISIVMLILQVMYYVQMQSMMQNGPPPGW